MSESMLKNGTKFIDIEKLLPRTDVGIHTDDAFDVEELKQSILSQGLFDQIKVVEEEGGYRVVHGERRRQAICSMTGQEYKEAFPNGVMCCEYDAEMLSNRE